MNKIVVATLVALLPAIASASPSGSLSYVGINNTGCSASGSANPNCAYDPSSAALDNAGMSTASATSGLSSGTLSVFASSDGTFGHFASAGAEIWNTFAFSGLTIGQTIGVTISGTASLSGSTALNYYADLVPAGNISTPNGGSGELIPLGTNGAFSFTTQFTVQNGALDNGAYVLNAGLWGTSGLCGDNGCLGSVTVSATVTWDVPANVTVTADAPFGVPEPTSMALAVPFAMMAWVRRRRSV